MKHALICLAVLTVAVFLFGEVSVGQWYQQNSGTTANLNAVTFTDANNGFAVGDSGRIVHTTNGGITWINQTSGTDLRLFDVCFTDMNNGWAVGGNVDEYWTNTDSSVILHTTNRGVNWITEIGGLGYGCFYDCCFIDANTGTIVGCFKDTSIDNGSTLPVMLRTTDGGLTWSEQTPPLPRGSLIIWPAVHYIDANNGWLTEEVGSMFSHPRIQKTTDGGTNWQLQLDSSFGARSRFCRIKFNNEHTGFAVGGIVPGRPKASEEGKVNLATYGTEGLILFSTDGGLTWIDADTSSTYYWLSPLNDVFLNGINVAIAVGESGTILQATYTVGSLIEQTSGTDSSLNGVYFVDDSTGWVVGDGGTILHTTNGGVTSVEPPSTPEIPTQFVLSQNYPNPFNPSTSIKYELPTSSEVRLSVYDLLGREVSVLVNERRDAGIHEVQFDASCLSSGVYLYRLQAGDFVQTKRLLLLK